MKKLIGICASNVLCALALLFLSGCGGGGSGATSSPPLPPPPPSPPPPVSAAIPSLSFSSVKNFAFTWTDVSDATLYRLLENPDSSSGFTQVGADISQGTQQIVIQVPLFARVNAQYILQSCNDAGCTESSSIAVNDTMVNSIGYFKASNTDAGDHFGSSIALSADGLTLAVGAALEASGNGSQFDNSVRFSGAVYVFTRDTRGWTQEAYLKGANPATTGSFGESVGLSGDGNTLAVGAPLDFRPESTQMTGAAYVFVRSNGRWTPQATIAADNADIADSFGSAVSLSGDGRILAIGAPEESSAGTGVNDNGDKSDNSREHSGAAYVFRSTNGVWSQQAYIKASNTDMDDRFGGSVNLSGDGRTLAIGADHEASATVGINNDEINDDDEAAGAVYVFTAANVPLPGTEPWKQEAYIKASNTGTGDFFGRSIGLSDNGNTLVVGAWAEDSSGGRHRWRSN